MTTCDVCGYEDTTKLQTAVLLSNDGVVRCEKCRNTAMFGEPWPDEDNAIERMAAGDYNKDAEIYPYPGSGKNPRTPGLGAFKDSGELLGVDIRQKRGKR